MTYYDARAWTGREAQIDFHACLSRHYIAVVYWRRRFDAPPGERSQLFGFQFCPHHDTQSVALRVHWNYWRRDFLSVGMAHLRNWRTTWIRAVLSGQCH